jgi:hypothetical protein
LLLCHLTLRTHYVISPPGNPPNRPRIFQRGLVQTATNSPGAIQANGSVTVNGNVPPPDRILLPDNVKAAVAILKQAPPDTRIYFITYPTNASDRSEIGRFERRLEEVFWEGGRALWKNNQLQIGSSLMTVEGAVPQGGGVVGCTPPTKTTAASIWAEQALAALGYPCVRPSVSGPEDARGSDFVLFVTVDGRPKPEE